MLACKAKRCTAASAGWLVWTRGCAGGRAHARCVCGGLARVNGIGVLWCTVVLARVRALTQNENPSQRAGTFDLRSVLQLLRVYETTLSRLQQLKSFEYCDHALDMIRAKPAWENHVSQVLQQYRAQI